MNEAQNNTEITKDHNNNKQQQQQPQKLTRLLLLDGGDTLLDLLRGNAEARGDGPRATVKAKDACPLHLAGLHKLCGECVPARHGCVVCVKLRLQKGGRKGGRFLVMMRGSLFECVLWDIWR